MMLNLRDVDDATILEAVVDEAQAIAEEWRKDLAVRIANNLAPHFKALTRTMGG
jgi:hypothetical protein